MSEGVVGIPDAARAPEVMEQASQLARDGDASASLVALGPASSDAFTVASEVAVPAEGSGTNNLGVAYKNGHGVTQDYAQALAWFRKAAEAGDAYGMNNLGLNYESRGVTRDDAQAVD